VRHNVAPPERYSCGVDSMTPVDSAPIAADARTTTDPVALSWLVTVRWTTILAGAGAVVAGRTALEAPVSIVAAGSLLAIFAASNLWLTWRVRAGRTSTLIAIAGGAVCADVALLSWLLSQSGGVLNPASVYYLVQIVVAALVLGRTWTWIVAILSVAGYAMLFLAPTDALRAAQGMHPEIALHMRGMWMAFALTAVIIAVLVSRLAVAVERRDRALEQLHDREARSARAVGLATLAAGAAHELSTPLATIAVAAHELDRRLASRGSPGGNDDWRALQEDARLIRSQADRCRDVLNALAGQTGSPAGEIPHASSLSDVLAAARAKLDPAQVRRLQDRLPDDPQVRWPIDVIARAVANVVQNALQASTALVYVTAKVVDDGAIRLTVADSGTGMTADELGRAGEPFFTTKAPGTGTGLGLFVARSSIEQLGGRFSLTSAPGVGTTATITLPRDVISRVAGPGKP
jgi:two-component system sensor histidine kinase RegB